MLKLNISPVFVTLLSCLHFTSTKICQIPLPEELQECYNRVQDVNVDQYVGSLYSWLCEHSLLGSHNESMNVNAARYETALRQVDPTVCLPYWDSTLDNQLTNPLSSSIWTAEYLGTPRGPVVSGPYAGWRLPNGGQLIRNVGADGELMNSIDIQNVLSRTRYADIVTSNSANPIFNLEEFHGGPHIYVGGAMSLLNTAAFDPVFFLHHAYIDYVFERFRARLRSIGVNPEIYPQVSTNSRHVATAPTGFSGYNQSTGYLESLARRATYEPVPTCSASSPSCGNRFLVCRTSSGRCIPTTSSIRTKRSADESEESETCDKEPHYGQPYQNDYCLGNSCNTSQWAMIPVRIVSVRPPKFQSYQSYPVSAGQVDTCLDIYSPAAYNQTKKYISNEQGNPKTYNRCEHDQPVGQIFLYSHGMNYAGYYKESTIVDQKFPVSVSMGFVGVKRPSPGEDGVTKVLIRAHDSCGRVCQVACKDPYTDEFKICSGAVAITAEKPLKFGYTLDEALSSVFDYQFDNECPRIKSDNVYVTVICNYRNKFPFVISKL